MAAFTTTMTTVSDLDDSLVLAYDQAYLVAVGQNNVMDALEGTGVFQYKVDINAKSITLPKYARTALATTALTENEDVASVALTDTGITLTPAEYGQVVTATKLASLQTGGKADLASAAVVGINHGSTMDKLACLALDASSNSYIIGGTAAGSVVSTQVANRTFLNYFYNKLARASVPMVSTGAGGLSYVMIAHDDVIHDLRADTSAGSWLDVVKYAAPGEALANEVGMFNGFRVIRNNNATYADQTGAGTVDLYNSYFLGFNAFGKATSVPGRLTITGPFDKLGRFVNVGWYEVSAYGIIDTAAAWLGQCASSVGANSA